MALKPRPFATARVEDARVGMSPLEEPLPREPGICGSTASLSGSLWTARVRCLFLAYRFVTFWCLRSGG